jgi:DNA repair exonuclease SbcCD ATPase subunit
MRRIVFTLLGVLELGVASVLAGLCLQLPSTQRVHDGFQHAEDISGRAGTQVRLFRNQVRELRRPELRDLSRRVQAEAQAVTLQLRSQAIDYDSVKAMRDALSDVAEGMDVLGRTVDETQLARVGRGLGQTARFLDERVVPAAERASKELDELGRSLQTDAERVGKRVRNAPADLRAAQALHDDLARLGDGIARMQAALEQDRLGVVRDSFGTLAEALGSGAEEIDTGREHLTFGSLALALERRTADSGDVSAGLRRAASAARSARTELARMADDLPRVNASLGESRRVVERTRDTLAVALREQDRLEPLLKQLPAQVATLADELPRLSGNLARLLRDTRALRELAEALRRAEQGFDIAVRRWPELRKMLGRSAELLRSARRHLDHTLSHRTEYDAAFRQTASLAEAFGSMLPLLTEHLDEQLRDQELALDDLGRSIDDVGVNIPPAARTTVAVLQTVKWLLALAAAALAIHGGYLLLSVTVARRSAS